MTYTWSVIINGSEGTVQASNIWTATTRAIKAYMKLRRIKTLKAVELEVVRLKKVVK